MKYADVKVGDVFVIDVGGGFVSRTEKAEVTHVTPTLFEAGGYIWRKKDGKRVDFDYSFARPWTERDQA